MEIYEHARICPDNTRHVSLADSFDIISCHFTCGNKHKLQCPTFDEAMMHLKTGSIQFNQLL
jgi:hypothetical protein